MLFVVWGYLPLCFGLYYGPKILHLGKQPCFQHWFHIFWLLWELPRWLLRSFPVHVLGCESVICLQDFKCTWLLISTFFSLVLTSSWPLDSSASAHLFHVYLDVKHLTVNLTRRKFLTLPTLFHISALVHCIILQQRTQYFIPQLRQELEYTMTSVPSSFTT